jgi:hypothetical protein
VRTCYYEIKVQDSDNLFIGGNDTTQLLQRDRTYYLATNLGIVLKIAFRNETWRIKQVAGPPARRDKAPDGGWSDCVYHPDKVTAYVFGVGHGYTKPDIAIRTIPGYLVPRI